MMKRIIGLLLCVAMLFSMASIGVSAAYQEHIPVSGTTQNVDGATYKIVKTASEFTSALSSGGLIMLGSDIALTSSSQLTIKAGTLIDGNGYAITYNGTLYGPLFLLGGGAWKDVPAFIGVGTILTAFFMGPLIDFFNRKLAQPMLNAGKTK